LTKGASNFVDNQFFVFSVFLANLIRDMGVLIVEIASNIILIVFLKKNLERRRNLNSVGCKHYKKVKMENMIVALVMCSFSVLIHAATFSVFLISLLGQYTIKFLIIIYLFITEFSYSDIRQRQESVSTSWFD